MGLLESRLVLFSFAGYGQWKEGFNALRWACDGGIQCPITSYNVLYFSCSQDSLLSCGSSDFSGHINTRDIDKIVTNIR